jgi:TrmH RNA methyltransferase
LRVFGVNACLALHAKRPQAIRKAYLLESRVPQFKAVLADLAKRKIGYRLVQGDDLDKLTQSTHHEGVCLDVLRQFPVPVTSWLAGATARSGKRPRCCCCSMASPTRTTSARCCASRRTSGPRRCCCRPGTKLSLSGAAARVAEGGAEAIDVLVLKDHTTDLSALERTGYKLVATSVRGGADLFTAQLPRQAVVMFGSESGGLSDALLRRAQERVRIPGTGAVESLNIASAVAVIAAEHWRRHPRGASRARRTYLGETALGLGREIRRHDVGRDVLAELLRIDLVERVVRGVVQVEVARRVLRSESAGMPSFTSRPCPGPPPDSFLP